MPCSMRIVKEKSGVKTFAFFNFLLTIFTQMLYTIRRGFHSSSTLIVLGRHSSAGLVFTEKFAEFAKEKINIDKLWNSIV